MSVTITINGDNAQEAGAELQTLARLLSGSAAVDQATTQAPASPANKPKPAARKAPAPELVEDVELSAEDIEMQRELNAPVEKAPAIASQVVDAGTGRPVGADAPDTSTEEAKPMTAADVRAAAAKLAAKDTPALAALLKKYNAPSLSAVPPESLGDFAGDVLEALG